MNSILPILTFGLIAVATSFTPPAQAQVVISDFNNAGFDVYSGGVPAWNTAAVDGPDFLTIGPNAKGGGVATFTPFVNGPIPDMTGTQTFHFDLRLGSGNQVSFFQFSVGSVGVTRSWNFSSLDLNTSTFTTMVFDLDNPDVSIGGPLDLANLNNVSFAGGTLADQGLDFRMQFDNLIGVPIPEPTSGILFGAVVLGGLLLRRMR